MPLPSTLGDEAVALLAALIRVDTTNPPGREAAAVELLAEALKKDGYEPAVREAAPGRANLIVRRKGDGTGGGPLLLTGHLDVVPADPAGWTHPPFAAEIADGFLWGRGALDMKHHVAACAILMGQLAREDVRLKRDVIFAAVADEEASCQHGSQFLVDQHPDLVRAEWALGEGGGFTISMGGQRLYPIMVAHRGLAWITMRAKGKAGHSSVPSIDSAVDRLARATLRLSNLPLPVHLSGPARASLRGLAQAQGGLAALGLRLLEHPSLTDFVLQTLVADPKARALLGSMVRNTAVVTQLKGSDAPNVLPAVAEATIDGRLVPEQTTTDLLREIREVVDDADVSFEVRQQVPWSEAPVGSPLYERIATALRAMDPGAHPFPFLVPGFTDAGAFAKLGIRTYGFTPIFAPDDRVSLPELVHGVDERIPVDGFKKGLQALWDVVVGFCG